jgi:probable HAF family extracellular repeat protein
MKLQHVLGFVSLVSIATPQTYTATIVLSQPGIPFFEPQSLNDNGVLAGAVHPQSGLDRAAYWFASEVTLLEQGPGASYARALNNSGMFAGSASPGPRSAAWKAGHYIDLGVDGEANDVNDSEWVVGLGFFASGSHGFLWRNGQLQDLGTLGIPGNTRSRAIAVNENGMVVGWESTPEFSNITSWYWKESTGMQRIIPNGGLVYDVNDLGQVLHQHRIWDNGNVIVLPETSELKAFNNHGEVVGNGWNNEISIWRNGVRFRIQDLLEPGQGLTVNYVRDINNAGQILVGGERNGQNNWYLLNPVPEPATLVALGLGIGVLLRHGRKKR